VATVPLTKTCKPSRYWLRLKARSYARLDARRFSERSYARLYARRFSERSYARLDARRFSERSYARLYARRFSERLYARRFSERSYARLDARRFSERRYVCWYARWYAQCFSERLQHVIQQNILVFFPTTSLPHSGQVLISGYPRLRLRFFFDFSEDLRTEFSDLCVSLLDGGTSCETTGIVGGFLSRPRIAASVPFGAAQ
jgi:hypothetical protein